MKKHIAGFILFSFIVGIFVFISYVLGLFTAKPTTTHCNFQYPKIKTVKTESKPVVTESEATVGAIDKNSPRVVQAVFNVPTKQVNLELLFKKKVVFDDYGWFLIKLNYFRNNGQGIKFIHSETVRFLPESFSNEDGKSSASVLGSYEWLDNLGSYDNIYVVAELTDNYSSDKATPKFDTNFAKEILLSYGKSVNGKIYDR